MLLNLPAREVAVLFNHPNSLERVQRAVMCPASAEIQGC